MSNKYRLQYERLKDTLDMYIRNENNTNRLFKGMIDETSSARKLHNAHYKTKVSFIERQINELYPLMLKEIEEEARAQAIKDIENQSSAVGKEVANILSNEIGKAFKSLGNH